MTIGVGWGRTLTASLASFHPPKHSGVKVMSLLGGAMETQFANPFEYAWRLATALQAECFLFPAPLVVDSAETKRRLEKDCGLDRLQRIAKSLDLAVVSAGDIRGTRAPGAPPHRQQRPRGTAGARLHRRHHGDLHRREWTARRSSDQRPHHVGRPAVLRTAKHIVLATGGERRAAAILAVIRCIGCNTLITDEAAARAMLARLVGRGAEVQRITRTFAANLRQDFEESRPLCLSLVE